MLKLNCPKCDHELIVRFLKRSEVAKCQNCGAETIIPADDSIETEKQPAYERPQSPQQICEPPPITRKKAIIIGCLSGVSMALVGITLVFNFTFPPSSIELIGAFIILPEYFFWGLLEEIGLQLTMPVMISTIIIIRIVICAAIGYLLVLIRHKLKWKEEFSIPFFALKIIGISIILGTILPIIVGLIAKFLFGVLIFDR
ncbi:MAG: hypothetical protein V1871_06310 [Planctomycetota bacterium]